MTNTRQFINFRVKGLRGNRSKNEMRKRRYIIERDGLPRIEIQFCTTCEKALENWALSHESYDLDAIKTNHENCKNIGRFKGDMCARLFISLNGQPEKFLLDEDE